MSTWDTQQPDENATVYARGDWLWLILTVNSSVSSCRA